MSPLEIILLGYAALGCVYWAWMLWGTIRIVRGVPMLAATDPLPPERWPRLSVIVAACNEQESIESAARSILAQDYPDLELIVVDDRSTDATGEIVDRITANDDRARAIHVTELPDGWLGKVHALDQGARAATGRWMLLTDADVHHRRDVLRRAVAFCEQHGVDHLAVAPDLAAGSFLLDVVISAFLRTFCVAMRCWKVPDPRARAYIGVGAFNLLRREAYDRTEGFAWLRMEVADDVALGMMLKQSGARSMLASGTGLVDVCWYPSLGDLLHGAEKGYASVAHCRMWRMLAVCLVMLLVELSPLLGLLPLAQPWLAVASLFMLAAAGTSIVVIHRWSRRPLLSGFCFPLAAILGTVVLLRTGWLGMRRGGVVWRGTLYPSEALRNGSRLTLP